MRIEKIANDEINTVLMEKTYELAVHASRRGDQPFGALAIAESGEIIETALNTAHTALSDGSHAEINLLNKLAEYDVSNVTIFTSTEPCLNCSKSIDESGVKAVYFGCSLDRYNNLWGKKSNKDKARKYNYELKGPIDEERGYKIHQIYFEKCFPANQYLAKWTQAYRDNKSFWGSSYSSYLKYLPNASTENDIALDLGCGDGRNAIELLKAGYKVTAIDALPQAILSAQSKSRDNLDFVCEDAIKYLEKLDSGSISVVLANHILQHITPSTLVRRFFSEVYRCLKNGGYFLGAYFIGPAGIHPSYVQKYAYLPNEGDIKESYILPSHYDTELYSAEIREDVHGGEHHFHNIERFVVVKRKRIT